MPITLGCTACGKRFRARDESAGKRVKCPYCGAAVQVPSVEESAAAASPTEALPPPVPKSRPVPPPAPRPIIPVVPPPPAAVLATPGNWGTDDTPDEAPAAHIPPSEPADNPFAAGGDNEPDPPKPRVGVVGEPRGAKPRKAERLAAPKTPKSPTQMAVPYWKKVKGGLGFVLFGLFLLALPGFAEFGKLVYARSVEPLPDGEGWLKIDGYLNSPEPDSVRLTKRQEIDILAYGLPLAIGGLALAFGRLTCGAAPRSSGAKGVFVLSGLATFVAYSAIFTVVLSERLLFRETLKYATLALVIGGALAEFWFLLGLAVSGAALKRPKAPRAVGFYGFVVGLLAVAVTVGWEQYTIHLRPKTLDDDVKLYEAAGLMLAWLIVIGSQWRAVTAVRGAIRDFLGDADGE